MFLLQPPDRLAGGVGAWLCPEPHQERRCLSWTSPPGGMIPPGPLKGGKRVVWLAGLTVSSVRPETGRWHASLRESTPPRFRPDGARRPAGARSINFRHGPLGHGRPSGMRRESDAGVLGSGIGPAYWPRSGLWRRPNPGPNTTQAPPPDVPAAVPPALSRGPGGIIPPGGSRAAPWQGLGRSPSKGGPGDAAPQRKKSPAEPGRLAGLRMSCGTVTTTS